MIKAWLVFWQNIYHNIKTRRVFTRHKKAFLRGGGIFLLGIGTWHRRCGRQAEENTSAHPFHRGDTHARSGPGRNTRTMTSSTTRRTTILDTWTPRREILSFSLLSVEISHKCLTSVLNSIISIYYLIIQRLSSLVLFGVEPWLIAP